MLVPDRLRVAVLGATGYTGAELLRLLLAHPRVELTALAAREKLTPNASSVLPSLRGLCELPIEPFDADQIASRADVAFCALPHGASIPAVQALRARGLMVLDLSADFRLRDPRTYATWYGQEHSAPELLSQAVYGLVELHREALRGARLIAVPGCYPTASTLPLIPLLRDGLIDARSVIIHAISGVSGAGRTPSASTHLPETAEGVRNYKTAGAHRHTPEIEQTLGEVCGREVLVTFTPALAPMTRGILSTQYVTARAGATAEALTESARRFYADSPSVVVLDPGANPDTLWVRGSNRAHLAYALDRRANRVVASCAIDNLVKGAAGQAVQCLNVAAGWNEGDGLHGAAMFP